LCLTERELAVLSRLPRSDHVGAFFVCWTRKEALLKGQGMGLNRQPAQLDVGLGAYDPVAQDSPVRMQNGWTLSALDVGTGYAGAVATKGALTRINVQRWRPLSVGAFAISA
jgi:4'-phosphopantetheinyl transferase